MSTPDIHGIVLDFVAVDFIDSQGTAKMNEILELAEQAGIALRLARVKPSVRDLLARDGVLERIGADCIHDGIAHTVENSDGGGATSSARRR